MKSLLSILLILLFMIPPASAAPPDCSISSWFRDGICVFEDVTVRMDDGTLVMEHDDPRCTVVEITDEYDLYIDGKRIDINDHQRKLVEAYYNLVIEVVDDAIGIGVSAAAVGLGGAGIGLGVVGKLFKLILPWYGFDDFENELREETRKIKILAEKLEIHARELEEKAEQAEDVYRVLIRSIPELQEREML